MNPSGLVNPQYSPEDRRPCEYPPGSGLVTLPCRYQKGPAPEADAIVRVGGRLDAAYASDRRTVSSHYAIDADRFSSHPELTSAHARQDAAIDAQYSATRRLSLVQSVGA